MKGKELFCIFGFAFVASGLFRWSGDTILPSSDNWMPNGAWSRLITLYLATRIGVLPVLLALVFWFVNHDLKKKPKPDSVNKRAQIYHDSRCCCIGNNWPMGVRIAALRTMTHRAQGSLCLGFAMLYGLWKFMVYVQRHALCAAFEICLVWLFK